MRKNCTPGEAMKSFKVIKSEAWDDPEIAVLDERRGTLPEFPIDAFAPRWRDLLLRTADGAGVTACHVAVPLLGIASSLVGTARRVRASRSWSEPLTLWTALVAASGERKTPALAVSIRALDSIERANAPDNRARRSAHETSVQRARETLKKWKADYKAALKDDRGPPPMPADAVDPGNFIEPRLFVSDPTVERLANLLTARPRGMMLVRDELAGFFANMHRYGVSARAFWLESWVGGRYIVERQHGKGSVGLDHLLIGVVGGFQPDRLARAFAGDDDGMSARFLYAWPETPSYRPLSNLVDEVDPTLANALTALIRLPAEDANGVFAPQDIWLSSDALAEFEIFRRWIDQAKHGFDGHEKHWLNKGETMVLRLAGTLAYMSWALALGTPSSGFDSITGALEPKHIDVKSVTAAIQLWRSFFWPHARAALRQVGLTDRHRHARSVLKWIKMHGRTEVSREDIRREALGQRLDAEQTQAVLDDLTCLGWLRLLTTTTNGRPKRRWETNPKLFLVQSTAESAKTA